MIWLSNPQQVDGSQALWFLVDQVIFSLRENNSQYGLVIAYKMQVSAVPDGSSTNLFKHSSGEKNQCLLFHCLKTEYHIKSRSNKYKNYMQQFMSTLAYCKIFISCLLRRSGWTNPSHSTLPCSLDRAVGRNYHASVVVHPDESRRTSDAAGRRKSLCHQRAA